MSLDQLDGNDDELLTKLAHHSATRTADLEQTPEPVLASVRTTIAGLPIAERPEVSLDSGRHYARLLQEGTCRSGRVELLSELGVGSFGYVFLARCRTRPHRRDQSPVSRGVRQ